MEEAIYAGLAAGGNEFVAQQREKRKAELEQKLLEQREAAAERREEARAARQEARELKKVVRTVLDPARGVNVMYNSQGDVLKEVPAAASDITKALNDEKRSNLELDQLEYEASTRDADREFQRRYKEAQISSLEAAAESSRANAAYTRGGRRRASEEDNEDVSDAEVVQSLIEGAGDIVKDLTFSKTDKDGNTVREALMSNAELQELALAAWRRVAATKNDRAGQQFKNPDDLFQQMLRKAYRERTTVVPKKAETPATGVNPFANQGR